MTFQATVTGDPSAGIDSVWVTWTGAGSGGHDSWQSIDLNPVDDNPNLYTATMTLPSGASAGNIRFIVQAANGAGLVTASDNLGAYNRLVRRVGGEPDRPDRGRSLVCDAAVGRVPADPPASARRSRATALPLAGKTVTFSIGADQATGVTDADRRRAPRPCRCRRRAGNFLLSAGFAGDTAFGPSGASATSRLTRPATTLTISGPSSAPVGDAERRHRALLKSGTTPLSFKTVWFVLTGPATVTVAVDTNLAGVAALGNAPSVGWPVHDHGLLLEADPAGTCPTAASLDFDLRLCHRAVQRCRSRRTWPFTGFLSPVDNLPTVNTATAGQRDPGQVLASAATGASAIFASGLVQGS